MRVVVTTGEPAGIGPDVLIGACQRAWPTQLVTIADSRLLSERASQLGMKLDIHPYDPTAAIKPHRAGSVEIIELTCPYPVVSGVLEVGNASWVTESLRLAAEGCMDSSFSAVVTAPVHKGIINDSGTNFSGHTEFFADIAGVSKVVMMLAAPRLRVALATTHLPLRDVPDAITRELLRQVLSILSTELKSKFGIQLPKILVAGLNPHAGEMGHLGMEEIDIIQPVIEEFDTRLAQIIGPLPADTLFRREYLQDADAVLAMYHDQGLPVLKSQGFGEAVNITLGLPFIRTSVDHGTALTLAGTGKAQDSSLIAAIQQAFELAALQAKSSLN
jgi:4-hydroxythreonine-4-phosphate dehydrogenase